MCLFCKCPDMKDSATTFTATFGGCVIVVRNVPCEECGQCGEKYFSNEIMLQLEKIVNSARKIAGEVFVTEYKKAA